jgi:hypothetical protein
MFGHYIKYFIFGLPNIKVIAIMIMYEFCFLWPKIHRQIQPVPVETYWQLSGGTARHANVPGVETCEHGM